MSNFTSIEWTEMTWNPTTGCTKISLGCKNCYAEIMAKRLCAMGVKGYENGFDLTLQPHRLKEPLMRSKPTMYFVNSMSDLFHEDITDNYINQVIGVIKRTPQHTYQILTKRARRMLNYFYQRDIPKNIWLGITVEDNKDGIPRIEYLKEINASIRFISIEPLLEDLYNLDLKSINWVIVGGESGPKARPMKLEWILKIKELCEIENVKFFFKQWGGWGADGVKRSKKKNGRLLLGRTWNSYPLEEYCQAATFF